jgi:transcriptional regulator with XRE-family HTH domain
VTSELAPEIGARIAERLEAEGLTQTAVAQAIGVPRQLVSLWILGRYAPSAANLTALADALDCTTDWLLGREDR